MATVYKFSLLPFFFSIEANQCENQRSCMHIAWTHTRISVTFKIKANKNGAKYVCALHCAAPWIVENLITFHIICFTQINRIIYGNLADFKSQNNNNNGWMKMCEKIGILIAYFLFSFQWIIIWTRQIANVIWKHFPHMIDVHFVFSYWIYAADDLTRKNVITFNNPIFYRWWHIGITF